MLKKIENYAWLFRGSLLACCAKAIIAFTVDFISRRHYPIGNRLLRVIPVGCPPPIILADIRLRHLVDAAKLLVHFIQTFCRLPGLLLKA